jgi:DNA repair photolyase
MPPRRVANPPNPWLSAHVEWLEEPPEAELEVHEERAVSVLSMNTSPDVPFRWSVNPYRGCWHACAYCYARPSHQHLGFGAGTDFDRRIVVKVNAPEVLALELARASFQREAVVFSGNTDCYQPLEASYGLTRRCLEVAFARRTPVAVITKSALVRRDLDLLARLARAPGAHVTISIPFLDERTARAFEPGAPSPARRFETLAAIARAGIPCGVSLAPLIPGLNDADVARLLERARAAGARTAFTTLVRLPAEVAPVFEARVREALPERWSKIEHALREMRGGALNDPRFGERMRGHGARYEAIQRLFELQCQRLGLNADEAGLSLPARRAITQGELF